MNLNYPVCFHFLNCLVRSNSCLLCTFTSSKVSFKITGRKLVRLTVGQGAFVNNWRLILGPCDESKEETPAKYPLISCVTAHNKSLNWEKSRDISWQAQTNVVHDHESQYCWRHWKEYYSIVKSTEKNNFMRGIDKQMRINNHVQHSTIKSL